MAVAKTRVPVDTLLLLSCLHRVLVGHAPFVLFPNQRCKLDTLPSPAKSKLLIGCKLRRSFQSSAIYFVWCFAFSV